MGNENSTNQPEASFLLSYYGRSHYDSLEFNDPRFVKENPGVLEALGLAQSKARLAAKQNSESVTNDSDDEMEAALEASRVTFANEYQKRHAVSQSPFLLLKNG